MTNTCLKDLIVASKGASRGVLKGVHFALCDPTPLRDCVAVCVSPSALPQGINVSDFIGGGHVPQHSEPAAHVYCGHQFGHFAGQLGDGRALYMGEWDNVELQVKGAGPTPCSRSADGRAVLRSSVREFLASEFMFFLGVPTTRAGVLGVSLTDTVDRDVFYDGHVKGEPAAVVLRIAESFLRFGSFQICLPASLGGDREGPSVGMDKEMLWPLLKHVVHRRYPHLRDQHDSETEQAIAWFGELTDQTARMVAKWQAVGFCHGVLNTDNLSAVGLTIDYGPFGFMERFHRGHICNLSDNDGRYSYENQPSICKWNLERLADALGHRVLPRERLQAHIDRYDAVYTDAYQGLMRMKLGLATAESEDPALFEALFDVMETTASDFTNTFRTLAGFGDTTVDATLDALLAGCGSGADRAASLKPATSEQKLAQYVYLAQNNPMQLYMMGKSPGWLVAQVEKYNAYVDARDLPVDTAEDRAAWSSWLDQYRARLAKETTTTEERAVAMNAVNPNFMLRNWVLEEAIRAAEDERDYTVVETLLKLSSTPYAAVPEAYARFLHPPPRVEIAVT